MKTDNPIKLGIDSTLRSAGFQRKSSNWYRDQEETILVVNLQKSNFGEQYYINLGVYVKGFPADLVGVLPKEHECHVRRRIESTPSEEAVGPMLLNLEDQTLGAQARKQLVAAMMAEQALPFLQQCGTRAGIQQAKREGKLTKALVDRAVQEALFT